MERPTALRNKLTQNLEAYQAERNRFLEKQYNFKFGDVKYGVGAAALLRSMYVELIFSKHAFDEPEASSRFLARLDRLYELCASLQNDDALKTTAMAVATAPGKAKFLPVLREMDSTYAELKRLERICGFE